MVRAARVLSVKRTREHASLLGAILGVVALVSGLVCTILGLVDTAVDDGARAVAAGHAGADLALRASLDLADDADAQDAEVRTAFDAALRDVTTDYAVDRTVAAEATLTSRRGDTSESGVTAVSVPGLQRRADLVAGAWPAGAEDVSLQADAAAFLGLRPGDPVTVGGVALRVAGTWRVRDPLDPRWLGEPQVTEGVEEGLFGPVVIDPSQWAELEAEPQARWVLVPDVDHVTADDLDELAAAWDGLDQEWQGEVEGLTSLEQDGRLVDVAREVDLRSDGLRAVEPATLLLLGMAFVVTLSGLGRLFVSVHAAEISLLWARGASAAGVAGAAALETGVAGIAGGLLGSAVVRSVPLGVAFAVAAGTGAAGAALVAAPTYRAATVGVQGEQRARAARGGRLVGPGLVALTVAAAALSVWQLRAYGSPVIVGADGVAAVDPVAVPAPALLLAAIVLLALLVFPAVASRFEGRAARAGLVASLVTRALARRLVPVAAPVVVVAVAAASLVSAAAYAQTWADGFDTTRALRTGADVRASTEEPGPDLATVDAVAALPGVEAIAPVAIQQGGDVGSIVAVSPLGLGLMSTDSSTSDSRSAMAAAITGDQSGPLLPAGSAEVRLELALSSYDHPPAATLQLLDAGGVLRELPLHREGGAGATTYAGELPRGAAAGPWTVAGVDIEMAPDTVTRPASVGVSGVAAAPAGRPLRAAPWDDGWRGQEPGDPDPLSPAGPGGQVAVDPDVSLVRLAPGRAAGTLDGPRVPVVVSATLAQRLGVEQGAPLTLNLDGSYEQILTEVADVVPAVPGAPEESAVLLDLAVVQELRLRIPAVPPPTDLWVGTDDPEGVAAAMRPLLPANARIDTAVDAAGRSVLGTTARAWWVGAVGCGLLGVLVLLTVSREQLRRRAGDVALLRALGLTAAQQKGLRRGELAGTVGYGLVAGVLAGVAVSVLVIPQLARAAVPEPYPTIGTTLGVDLLGLLAGLVALIGTLGLVVVGYAAKVGAQARASGGVEGER